MKRYCIEVDEKLAEEIETVARDIAKLRVEELIVLLVAKQLAPWHRLVKLEEGKLDE